MGRSKRDQLALEIGRAVLDRAEACGVDPSAITYEGIIVPGTMAAAGSQMEPDQARRNRRSHVLRAAQTLAADALGLRGKTEAELTRSEDSEMDTLSHAITGYWKHLQEVHDGIRSPHWVRLQSVLSYLWDPDQLDCIGQIVTDPARGWGQPTTLEVVLSNGLKLQIELMEREPGRINITGAALDVRPQASNGVSIGAVLEL